MAKVPKSKRVSVEVPPGGWQAAKKRIPSTPAVSDEKRVIVLDTDHPEIAARRLVWRFNEIDTSGDWPPAAIGVDAMANLLMTALTEIPQFCSSKFLTLGRSAA